jgi:hypothetical protein
MVEIISPLRDLGRGGAGGQEGALFALEDVLRNGAWAKSGYRIVTRNSWLSLRMRLEVCCTICCTICYTRNLKVVILQRTKAVKSKLRRTVSPPLPQTRHLIKRGYSPVRRWLPIHAAPLCVVFSGDAWKMCCRPRTFLGPNLHHATAGCFEVAFLVNLRSTKTHTFKRTEPQRDAGLAYFRLCAFQGACHRALGNRLSKASDLNV